MNRRELLRLSGALAATPILGIPDLSVAAPPPRVASQKLKVVVAGGHPDDPESGCGGTIARYADAGHDVVALYLTRGEAGIPGTSHEDAARIRTGESEDASAILGARPFFFGQIDGSSEVSNRWYDAMHDFLMREKPDLVFVQWPIDTHRDHRTASLLVYDACMRLNPRPALFYYEVMTGDQTQTFHPSHYVDISAVEPKKRKAVFAHKSQKPEEWYSAHEQMSRFRGLEFGCEHAEGFVRHERSREVELIP